MRVKENRGSATIEAVVSFTAFLFVIFTVLGVVNYCRAEAMISSAVNGAAKELSEYSYLYKMSGLSKLNNAIEDAGDEGVEPLNGVANTLDSLYAAFSKVKQDGQSIIDDANSINVANAIDENQGHIDDIKTTIEGLPDGLDNIDQNLTQTEDLFNEIRENPKQYMKCLVAVAGSECVDLAKSYLIAAPLSKAFTLKHFDSGEQSADDVLKSLGVVDGENGLNFNMSTIFTNPYPDEIHIVVYYKIKLFNFFGNDFGEVTTCKEAVVRAWLSGDAQINNPNAAPTEPATQQATTYWDLSSMSRGKTITELERERLKGEGNYSHVNYFDSYNRANNEFFQVHSIDVYCNTYSNPSQLKSTIEDYCKTFKNDMNKVGSEINVFNSSGASETIHSDTSSRKLTMIIVIPDNSSIDSSIINSVKQQYPDINIVVKNGYGVSPNQNQS